MYVIANGLLNIPQPSKVPQSQRILPYAFIADDAFGLKNHLMRMVLMSMDQFQHLSHAERVFNNRSLQAQTVIENAFGVAACHFCILHRPIIAQPTTVMSITKAIVALHSLLMSLNSNK